MATTKKKSASFTGKPKSAAAPKAKAEPKKRIRHTFEERTTKAQAKYDRACAKQAATLAKLETKQSAALDRLGNLDKLVEEKKIALAALGAAGPKLPKARVTKDPVAAALAKSEKKAKKLEEQLAKEKATMDRIRAERGTNAGEEEEA